MTEGTELSASESLAWQLAYDSNDAYDTLHEARAKQVKYEEIGNVCLEGVTVAIDGDVMETITKEVEGAEREFSLVKGMAHAAAIMEDSPFALASSIDLPPPQRKETAPAGKPAGQPERPASEAMEKRIDGVVVYLLDRDGSVTSEGGASPGAIIPEALGFSRNEWTNTRPKLADRELVVFTKATPEAKRFKEISVNEATLSTLREEGALSDEVLAAMERREKRAQVSETAAAGGEPGFLDNRGGEETAAGEVDEVEVELGIDDELDSIRIRHQPAAPAKNNSLSKKDGKVFTFGFETMGRSVRRSMKVSELKKLPKPVRLLLGFGQVNTPMYDFYRTEEQKHEFVLRVVNKGVHEESQQTDQAGLEALIEEALGTGYLHRNGAGLELTAEGMDFVLNTKFRRAKLGQKHILDAALKSKTTGKARQTAPSDLTKATLVA